MSIIQAAVPEHIISDRLYGVMLIGSGSFISPN